MLNLLSPSAVRSTTASEPVSVKAAGMRIKTGARAGAFVYAPSALYNFRASSYFRDY